MDCLELMKLFGHFLIGLSEILLACSTIFLAFYTFRLVKETQQMAKDARESPFVRSPKPPTACEPSAVFASKLLEKNAKNLFCDVLKTAKSRRKKRAAEF
jgi:hypothetical protein